MKYLNKFYNYLNESVNLDIDDLKDIVLSLEDIADITIKEDAVFFKNEYKKAYSLLINISKLNKETIIENSFQRNIIDDNKYWEILDELINIKNRLTNNVYTIIFEPFPQSTGSNIEINKIKVHIILNKLSEDILKGYYLKLNAKLNSMKTEFSYNTVIYKDEVNNTITALRIKSDNSSYSDRKFNNLISGIVDKEKVNINKNVLEYNTSNTIILK
jgi:hypothetical protein